MRDVTCQTILLGKDCHSNVIASAICQNHAVLYARNAAQLSAITGRTDRSGLGTEASCLDQLQGLHSAEDIPCMFASPDQQGQACRCAS